MGNLAPEDITALAEAVHPDPAAILGPHPTADGLRIVCFLPRAAAVAVAPLEGAGAPHEMARLHPDGLFVALVPDADPAWRYRLRVTEQDGTVTDVDDPYAFPPLLGDLDLHLLGEGTHLRSYDLLGAHLRTLHGVLGVHFAVWAPNARSVSVVGDFNAWDARCHPLRRRGAGGIWELFIPALAVGTLYKYRLVAPPGTFLVDKADPYAFTAEVRPSTASIVADLAGFAWQDADWIAARAERNPLTGPMSIYEVHLGSWRRTADGNFLNYRELAHQLVDYLQYMGFTHIELMPITEHPVDVSWGYQTTGYYAPTSRFGSPQDFMYFVDYCHRHGIGVLLDWVPSHFAREGHGLGFFDGAHEYEHSDPRQGESQWGSYVFNYGRGEVRGFLLSNALFWLEQYHLDGFRVDAVASMIYLDFLKPAGTWVPNRFGGAENLEAIAFIRRFNELVHEHFPGAVTMAEESTSWPMVSRPVYLGGLGFTMKWNMGWMHDTLEYFKRDPIHRRYIHSMITFSMLYHYSENYVLPLSHDEVVHGKSPLVYKAPGDEWRKFASLRLLLGYMWTHPGKKLLFMGGEFAQTSEWNYAASLRWELLHHEAHQGMQHWMRDLNHFYLDRPALFALDYDPSGFHWIDCNDVDQSVLIMERLGASQADRRGAVRRLVEASTAMVVAESAGASHAQARGAEAREQLLDQRTADLSRAFLIAACNFTPTVRHAYRFGVPLPGIYTEVLNSDARPYWGSGVINEGDFASQPVRMHGYEQSIVCTLPPLGISIFELASVAAVPQEES